MESKQEVASIADRIRPLKDAAMKRLGFIAVERCSDFAQQLKKKYPDAKKYRAYHALTSSSLSVDEPGIIEEDFPCSDSIVGFLRTLAKIDREE